jgi:hypothetical protein
MPIVDAVECPVDAEEEGGKEEGIPFIEVGGPRSTIDASPEVLAAPAPGWPVPAKAEPEGAAPEVVSIWCSWTIRPGTSVAK